MRLKLRALAAAAAAAAAAARHHICVMLDVPAESATGRSHSSVIAMGPNGQCNRDHVGPIHASLRIPALPFAALRRCCGK